MRLMLLAVCGALLASCSRGPVAQFREPYDVDAVYVCSDVEGVFRCMSLERFRTIQQQARDADAERERLDPNRL